MKYDAGAAGHNWIYSEETAKLETRGEDWGVLIYFQVLILNPFYKLIGSQVLTLELA